MGHLVKLYSGFNPSSLLKIFYLKALLSHLKIKDRPPPNPAETLPPHYTRPSNKVMTLSKKNI